MGWRSKLGVSKKRKTNNRSNTRKMSGLAIKQFGGSGKKYSNYRSFKGRN
jgi:hypothetical protein